MPFNKDIRGWMMEVELKALEAWARQLPDNSKIVEVGSFYGRSAFCFAASAPTSQVYCFDQWVGEEEQPNAAFSNDVRDSMGFPIVGTRNTLENFLENTKGLPNIHHKQVYSPEQIEWKGGEVDFVFIDASHSNPSDWDYIAYWLPFIKPGGFIAGHDYNGHFQAVMDNVARLHAIFKQEPEVPEHTTLWRFKT